MVSMVTRTRDHRSIESASCTYQWVSIDCIFSKVLVNCIISSLSVSIEQRVENDGRHVVSGVGVKV
jgi:hypothetical protein